MKSTTHWLIFILAILTSALYAQNTSKPISTYNEINDGIANLKVSKNKKQSLQALLKLGNSYRFKPGENKKDLDSGILLAQQAKKLSIQLKDDRSLSESIGLLIGCYSELAEQEKMLQYVKELSGVNGIQTLTHFGDHYYLTSYGYKPMNLPYLDKSLIFYKQKLLLSKQLKINKYIQEAIGHLEQLISVCIEMKEYTRIEEQTNWLKENTRDLHLTFPSMLLSLKLSDLFMRDGKYDQALERVIYALKMINAKSSKEEKLWMYGQAGQIYRFIGNHTKSNFYYAKLLDMAMEYSDVTVFSTAYLICYNHRQLNQTAKAIAFVTDLQRRYSPRSSLDSIYLYRCLAENFSANKQVDLALRNWLTAKTIAERSKNNSSAIWMNIGFTYHGIEKYAEADEAYERCEQEARNYQHVPFLANLYSSRSEVKAKLGDYQSALRYLENHKKMADSIYIVSKEKHTQELEIQYETQKKEAQLKQRADEIYFLNRQKLLQLQNTRLQQIKLEQADQLASSNSTLISLQKRDIELKTKDYHSVSQIAYLQSLQLKQAESNKKVTVTIIILLSIIIALVFWQFRQKTQVNRVVTEKNNQLNKLVDEKEWLLKEMHHRVKNNLQIIISLLESQQAGNLDQEALKALETSKNRIFAISLIHQKLYQSTENKTVDMSCYIPELVSYLKDCFLDNQNITFCVEIDPIMLNVGRAIPLGLIINETVTNSLKYAFAGRRAGQIKISLQKTDTDEFELSVCDDGKGFDVDKRPQKNTSMGMTLIKGLSMQIGAKIKINRNNGTSIVLSEVKIQDDHEDHHWNN